MKLIFLILFSVSSICTLTASNNLIVIKHSYTGLIDKDQENDYLAIVENKIFNDSDTIVQTNLLFVLSENTRDTLVVSDFLPPKRIIDKKVGNEMLNTPYVVSITKEDRVLLLTLGKEDIPLTDYMRQITLSYDKKKKTLKLISDGGIGVFGRKKHFEKVKKLAKESVFLENWNDWYSSFMFSDTITLQNKRIFVKNEKDFLKNIDSNRTLIIKKTDLDLSLVNVEKLYNKKYKIKIDTITKSMGVAYNDSAWWINNISNFSVIGTKTAIKASSSNYVFWLNGINNLTLSNLTFSNVDNKSKNWVLCVSNSQNVQISNSQLFNGNMTLFLYKTTNAYIRNSCFTKAYVDAILLRQSKDIVFANCDVTRSRDVVQIQESDSKFLNCAFYNNQYFYLVFLSSNTFSIPSKIALYNCLEYNNSTLYKDDGCKIGYENYFGLSDADSVLDINSGSVNLEVSQTNVLSK